MCSDAEKNGKLSIEYLTTKKRLIIRNLMGEILFLVMANTTFEIDLCPNYEHLPEYSDYHISNGRNKKLTLLPQTSSQGNMSVEKLTADLYHVALGQYVWKSERQRILRSFLCTSGI